jgi:hypothetical protein
MERQTQVVELMAQIFATGSRTSDMLREPSQELRAQMTDGPVRLFHALPLAIAEDSQVSTCIHPALSPVAHSPLGAAFDVTHHP